eukprot:symbB.v1.2.012358.t1/scaffold854.1/size229663/12
MNDISLPDFHLRFVDNLESVSCSDGQQEMLLEPGIDDDLPRSELRALAAAQQAEVASNKDTTKVRL